MANNESMTLDELLIPSLLPRAYDFWFQTSLEAADAGYPANCPFRYRQAQRIWFYLPFIHAEDLRMQELAREKDHEMGEDLTRLLDGDAMALSDDEQECRRVLAENRARLGEQLDLHFRVQREHYEPVARFKRFPHRNEALRRGDE